MANSRVAVIVAAVFELCAAVAAAEERYVAWLADGTRLTAQEMSAWPLPGAPFLFAGRDLLAASNPARLLVDRQRAAARKAPFLELANGDVLPGAPVQLESEEGRQVAVARVRVLPEPPLLPASGPGISVRTDRVRRLVLSPSAATQAPPPGTVVFADGRRIAARAIRWRDHGLAMLTDEQVTEVAFSNLADVVFPGVDIEQAVIEDNMWSGSGSGVSLLRFQVTNGAVLTATRISREQEPDRRRGRFTGGSYFYVQPTWADMPLALPEAEIVCCSYRAGDEVPLTSFAASEVANSRLVREPAAWTINQPAAGGLLASRGVQSDLGIGAHAHSAIAFDLPKIAATLEMSVGLDQAVGDGGCVRCKVTGAADDSRKLLWDSGVFQGKDGAQETGRLAVAGLASVQLVTEFAHETRPDGADPLDIRDSVVWLAPLVRLDLSRLGTAQRALAVLPGAADWAPTGNDWQGVQLANRWNVPASNWDTVVSIPGKSELGLTRTLHVSRANDVVELLTVCPTDLDEHDFSLRVNGEMVPWSNNADRQQLRQWTLRYSRTRAREGDQEANLTDRLAYWWDLSPWRGQEVTLELVLRGKEDRNEVAWRELSVRSAIGNVPASGDPLAADVSLTALTPLGPPERDHVKAVKNAVPGGSTGEPIRLLGQTFESGYGLARDSRVSFAIKPQYRSFVAVVGCPAQVAGPVQVLIDGRAVWERASISSLSPGEQIEIAIPARAKTLTLQNSGDGLYYGAAAFARAGFMLSSSP